MVTLSLKVQFKVIYKKINVLAFEYFWGDVTYN